MTRIAEKTGDSHFYGSWKGGTAKAGGGPAGGIKPTDGMGGKSMADTPAKPDQQSLAAFQRAAVGDRIEATYVLPDRVGDPRAHTIAGEVAKRTDSTIYVHHSSGAQPFDRSAMREMRITNEANRRELLDSRHVSARPTVSGGTRGRIGPLTDSRMLGMGAGKVAESRPDGVDTRQTPSLDSPTERTPLAGTPQDGAPDAQSREAQPSQEHRPDDMGALAESVTPMPLSALDYERLLVLAEKDDEGHFFGPWKGGSAKAGGGPAAQGDTDPKHKYGLTDEALKDYGTAVVRPRLDKTPSAADIKQFENAKVGDRVNVTFTRSEGKEMKTIHIKDGVVVGRTDTNLFVQAGNQGVFNVMHGKVTETTGLGGPAITGMPKTYGNLQGINRRGSVDIQQARWKAESQRAIAKRADTWVVAGGGSETPFTRNGTRYQYVFNPKTRQHGFLNLGTDIVTTDKDFYKEALASGDEFDLTLTLLLMESGRRDHLTLAEKTGSGDHFYGAWRGGAAKAGGGPAGESHDGAMTGVAVTGDAARKELASRDATALSTAMEGAVGKNVTLTYFDPQALRDGSDIVSKFTVKGKVESVTSGDAGLNRAKVAFGDNRVVHVSAYNASSIKVGSGYAPSYPPAGGLSKGRTSARGAPKLPPKGQSVLERPQTKSGFGPKGGGYNKSGTPIRPGGSEYGHPNPNKGWRPTWGGGGDW